jgi:DNA-binding IclR family transcriptional regulator
LPPAQLEELLTQHALPRHNENTIVSARQLKEQLERIRKVGYAVDDEEDEIGLRCIGVPIFDRENRVVAAISVAGTTAQITRENRSKLAELMKSAAFAISRRLGFQSGNATCPS